MKKEDRKFFSPLDILIIVIVFAVSVLSFLLVFSRDNDNLTCVVRCDSEVVYTVNLDEVKSSTEKIIDCEYPLKVVVEKECVYVKDACCPDKLCEHTGKIYSENQSIVCLPAKVSITLVSDDNTVDAVVG